MCMCVVPPGQCLPPAHLDGGVSRRYNHIANNEVRRAVMDWLNLVIERDIGDCHFHDVGCKPSPRAALFYVFFVNVYTFIGI